jgi:predicted DNA binding CopG/RHH family protein
MKKQKKPLEFKSEREESDFWAKAESTEYIDRSTARAGLFPNLKPTSKSIPIRLPVALLDRLMVKAHKCGVPYQSLLKLLVVKGLRSL